MSKHTMVCAGIDTAKHKLDVALADSRKHQQVSNDTAGYGQLEAWLRRHDVERVGIEASGGYERAVVRHLRRAGFVVVVFQPGRVRAYGAFLGKLAKNDKIDARLIAACTAAVKEIYAPPDPRLEPFAEHLTLIDQLNEDVARCKHRRETCRDGRLRRYWDTEITRLEAQVKAKVKELAAAIRQHADLAERLALIQSVVGVGPVTAIAVLVRMPEIGQVSRERAAALAGLAPYDDDSSDRHGHRHIKGGRERLRRSLYTAALPASFRWNDQLNALYWRLRRAGKTHKEALIASARKLLIFINAVVARGTPWVKQQPATPHALPV
jgi:transposase